MIEPNAKDVPMVAWEYWGIVTFAMADLCKNLGYKPSKMWGTSFKELLK